MTLMYETDLDIPKMYLHTENEVSRVNALKRWSPNRQTNRQTDTEYATESITTPHLRVVILTSENCTEHHVLRGSVSTMLTATG